MKTPAISPQLLSFWKDFYRILLDIPSNDFHLSSESIDRQAGTSLIFTSFQFPASHHGSIVLSEETEFVGLMNRADSGCFNRAEVGCFREVVSFNRREVWRSFFRNTQDVQKEYNIDAYSGLNWQVGWHGVSRICRIRTHQTQFWYFQWPQPKIISQKNPLVTSNHSQSFWSSN